MSAVSVAWHEAGHALVARQFGRHVDVVEVTVTGGSMVGDLVTRESTPEDIEKALVVVLAGEVAERYAPAKTAAGTGPIEFTVDELEALYAWEDAPADGSLRTPSDDPTDAEVVELHRSRIGDDGVERARQLAEELVEREHVIGRLALVGNALLSRRRLTGGDLAALVHNRP